jgi:hypothetical protein
LLENFVIYASKKQIMKKIFSVYLIFMGCFAIKAGAQTADGGMKAWQDYMTPGDMHKMLAKYDGTWNESVTVWMQPGAAPTNSNSTAVNQMILGGLYQESKITGSIMGMPFEGFSLLGYDKIKKTFTSTWLDNFKGSSLNPMSGKNMDEKEVVHYIDDNTQKVEMFMETPNGEFKTMEINMTRAK